MKLSVNIITYNREKELLRGLESLKKQNFKDYEIVIVDNNSTDDTEAKVKEFIDKNETIRFKYEKQSKNLGVAGGRNRAFEMSSGEYIFTFDDDAIIEDKEFFNKAIKELEHDISIKAAAVNIYEPHSQEYKSYSIIEKNKNKNVLSFIGAANFLRKDFFENGPLYPEKLHFGAEELYPCLKAWGAGQRVAYFEGIEIIHLPSKINRYIGKERILNGLLNRYIIMKLCFPLIIHPFLTLNFIMRLAKYKMLKLKDIKEIRKLYKERYNKKEKAQMSFKRWLELKKMFGVKRVS